MISPRIRYSEFIHSDNNVSQEIKILNPIQECLMQDTYRPLHSELLECFHDNDRCRHSGKYPSIIL